MGAGRRSAGSLAERVALPLEPSAWDEAWAQSAILGPSNHRRGRSRRSTLRSRRSSPSFSRPGKSVDATWFQAAAEVPVANGRRGSRDRRCRSCPGGLRRHPAHAAGPAGPGRFVRNRHHRRTCHGRGRLAGGRDRARARNDGQCLAPPHGPAPLDRHASIRPAPPAAGLGPRHSRVADSRHLLGNRRRRPRASGSPSRRPGRRSLGHLGGRRCRASCPICRWRGCHESSPISSWSGFRSWQSPAGDGKNMLDFAGC